MSSTEDSRRVLHIALVAVLAGWAIYTGILATGHFLSLIPKYRGESAWLILAALTSMVALSAGRLRASPLQGPDVRVSGLPFLLVAFAVLSFGVYAGVLSLGLLSDDYVLLARVTRHDFFVGSQFFRPIPLLGWALAPQGAGAEWSLHAANVLLHGVNATLVAVLARTLGVSRATAAAAGLLFACFPASVEAVAWASGVQDILMTTGCLGFVLACAIDERPHLALALSTIALLIALGSKETAVAAPVLACVAWFRTGGRWHPRPIVCGVLVTGMYAVLRMSAFPVESNFPAAPSSYFVKELLSRVFSALAVPFTRAELLRLPALGIVMTWLFAGLLVHLAWRSRTDRRPAVAAARCAIWAVVSALPVWAMFFVSPDLQGSRYLYLPMCGWSILVAVLLMEAPAALRRIGLGLIVVLAVVWLLGVRSHLRDWQEAAQVRDRVLSSAVNRLQSTPCAVLGFTQLPDSVGGAYVFRNGFLEALRGREAFRAQPAIDATGRPGCTLRWDGETFR